MGWQGDATTLTDGKGTTWYPNVVAQGPLTNAQARITDAPVDGGWFMDGDSSTASSDSSGWEENPMPSSKPYTTNPDGSITYPTRAPVPLDVARDAQGGALTMNQNTGEYFDSQGRHVKIDPYTRVVNQYVRD